MGSALTDYYKKRDFDETPEPRGGDAPASSKLRFVVQKHAASRLHYDLRLEMDGVFRSWAVPKGPSLDPDVRSLAVHVEDHPLEYGFFEGIIPEGQYGGGTVMLWDHGTWEPEGNPVEAYQAGKIKGSLRGQKLKGSWVLFRMKGDKNGDNWLLQKRRDDEARSADELNVLEQHPHSVVSGRSLDEIAEDPDWVWDGTEDAHAQFRTFEIDITQIIESDKEEDFDLGLVPEVRKLPDFIRPQLAESARDAPRGDDWLHELKLDGYRILTRIADEREKDGVNVRLFTRNENDWTDRFPTIAPILGSLPANTVLDGEVAVLLKDGTTDFQALQNTLKGRSSGQLAYYVFDMPFCAGHDLRNIPLVKRKSILSRLVEQLDRKEVIKYSDHIVGQGEKVYLEACNHGLEGIISKRRDARYISSRTRTWLKTKCLHRQEFVVGGWTDPSGARGGFGALVLGYYDRRGRFSYAGRVGTGFKEDDLREISGALERIAQDASPFHDPPTGEEAKDVHWTTPELVAEIEFTSWTNAGRLRHASFKGLREDKPPHEVRREQVSDNNASGDSATHNSSNESKPSSNSSVIAGVSLSNPDRKMYHEEGQTGEESVTKKDLAQYMVDVADWILPHVVGRPLSLVRCPEGITGECFYQKHLTEGMPDEVLGVDVQEEGEEPSVYASVDDVSGLIALVQMSVLEMHPWGSRSDRLDRPDRLIFDLDPGEGTAWEVVVEAARQVGDVLDELGLESFVRTTGGKGLHIVAPISRRSSWDELKAFAKAIAKQLAAEDESRYVATVSKEKRKGRIFVDYLRNSRGSTAIASYSPRARSGAPVCTPVRWDELNTLERANKYTISNIRRRLRSLETDPWEGFFDLRQSLTKDMLSAVGAEVD